MLPNVNEMQAVACQLFEAIIVISTLSHFGVPVSVLSQNDIMFKREQTTASFLLWKIRWDPHDPTYNSVIQKRLYCQVQLAQVWNPSYLEGYDCEDSGLIDKM
jgi:hypothetical protein